MGACYGAEASNRYIEFTRVSGADVSETYVPYSGSGPWFTCEPNGEVQPRLATRGKASEQGTPPSTSISLLLKAVERCRDKPHSKVERGLPPVKDNVAPDPLPAEDWKTWTYGQLHDEIRSIAKAFIKLGMQPFDSVNIWGFNAPEWIMASYAAQFAGGKAAGIYPTDTDETASYKVVHSGGSIIVVEEKSKIAKLAKGIKARGDAKSIKAIIVYGEGQQVADGEKQLLEGCGEVPVLSWEKCKKMGEEQNDNELDNRIRNVRPGHCCALIYTSGTTGDPKAVMVSHDNLIFASSTVFGEITRAVDFSKEEQMRAISYLPLSHVAGMMVDIVGPVYVSAYMQNYETIYYARPYDLKMGTIKFRLQVARPTLFLGVPLVWEKIADKIRAIGAANTGLKKAIGDFSKRTNLDYRRGLQIGEQPGDSCCRCLSTKVMGKVKAELGLDQCIFAFTGAAPIRKDTLEYYGSLDMSINEVYGMSECCGATTWSVPPAHQWGSCGYELPGTEVKVYRVDEIDFNKKTECDKAPSLDSTDERYQGEICFRGRHIMMGYLAQPALGAAHVAEIKKKTAETIDKDGWLHSGDKGLITKDGMVKITGRYKELIIGEGGENIAPVPIEDHVKRMCDGVNEVMMVGDKRKYNIALVTLKAKGANGEVPGEDNLDAGALRVNEKVSTISAAMADDIWIKTITDAITSANNNGQVCANNAAKIQKFTILPTNFSEENNELTPTKKLKRKVVETIYKDLIEKMYATNGTYIPFNK